MDCATVNHTTIKGLLVMIIDVDLKTGESTVTEEFKGEAKLIAEQYYKKLYYQYLEHPEYFKKDNEKVGEQTVLNLMAEQTSTKQ